MLCSQYKIIFKNNCCKSVPIDKTSKSAYFSVKISIYLLLSNMRHKYTINNKTESLPGRWLDCGVYSK